jgi:hypothetical protein
VQWRALPPMRATAPSASPTAPALQLRVLVALPLRFLPGRRRGGGGALGQAEDHLPPHKAFFFSVSWVRRGIC